jgi:magnesium transporter
VELLPEVQQILQTLCLTQLVDLHVADLLNDQLPSHYDYTSQYDVLVFRRRLAGRRADANPAPHGRDRDRRNRAVPQRPARAAPRRHPPGRLRRVRPGAAVGASGRRRGARRLRRAAAGRRHPTAEALRRWTLRATSARLPTSPPT